MTEFEKFVVYGAFLGAAPVTRKILEACSYSMLDLPTATFELEKRLAAEKESAEKIIKELKENGPVFELQSFPLPLTKVEIRTTGYQDLEYEELGDPTRTDTIPEERKCCVSINDLVDAACRLGGLVEKRTLAALLEFAKPGDEQTLAKNKFYGPFEYVYLRDRALLVQTTPDVCRIIVAKLPEVVDQTMQCIIVPQVRMGIYGACGIASMPLVKGKL